MNVISEIGECRVKEIRNALRMTSSLFSVYRDRLKRKGVVKHGGVRKNVPYFATIHRICEVPVCGRVRLL